MVFQNIKHFLRHDPVGFAFHAGGTISATYACYIIADMIWIERELKRTALELLKDVRRVEINKTGPSRKE